MSKDKTSGVGVVRRDGIDVEIRKGTSWDVEDDGSLSVYGPERVATFAPNEWTQVWFLEPQQSETSDNEPKGRVVTDAERNSMAYIRGVLGDVGVASPDYVAARLVLDGGVKAP